MATHSSILAWRIPRTEEPVGYGPWDSNSWINKLIQVLMIIDTVYLIVLCSRQVSEA